MNHMYYHYISYNSAGRVDYRYKVLLRDRVHKKVGKYIGFRRRVNFLRRQFLVRNAKTRVVSGGGTAINMYPVYVAAITQRNIWGNGRSGVLKSTVNLVPRVVSQFKIGHLSILHYAVVCAP